MGLEGQSAASGARVAAEPASRLLIGVLSGEAPDLLLARLSRAGFVCRVADGVPSDLEAADLVVLTVDAIDRPLLDRLADAWKSASVVLLYREADEIDRILALEAGADDVLSLTMGPQEIAARLRALHRRLDRGGDHGRKDASWILRPELRALIAPDGGTIRLTESEYKVARILAEARGEVVTREHLTRAYHDGRTIKSRSSDTLILRLRKKTAGYHPPLIRTMHRDGYYFGVPVKIDVL